MLGGCLLILDGSKPKRTMRILVLCKRQYTGKDLLDDRYGRLFELPERLSALGNDVRGISLSYRRRREGEFDESPGVRWWSLNAWPAGAIRYAAMSDLVTKDWRPDVIWASSDALHGMVARLLSYKLRIPYVVDLYDNYESFGLTRMPGLRRGFRWACRGAAGLTVVTKTLKEFVELEYRPTGAITVLGNGVDPVHFHPLDKMGSRRALDLPLGAKLIGTAGSITQDRGIGDLFEAFEALAKLDENVWLVYAGPRDGTALQYAHPRVRDLGLLPHSRVPELLSALDVAIVCNRDSEFGRFCYPMKLEEAIACGTPVVAARVGDVAARLSEEGGFLYQAGDWLDLASKVRSLLDMESAGTSFAANTWASLALTLQQALAGSLPAAVRRIG